MILSDREVSAERAAIPSLLAVSVVHHHLISSGVRNRVGLAWLLGLEVFCNWAETSFPGQRVFLIWNLALGLAVYTVGAVVSIGVPRIEISSMFHPE